MEDPFEIRPVKDARAHSGARVDNTQAPTEVPEASDVVSTVVVNPMVPLQNVGDASRSSVGPPSQGAGPSLNLPARSRS